MRYGVQGQPYPPLAEFEGSPPSLKIEEEEEEAAKLPRHVRYAVQLRNERGHVRYAVQLRSERVQSIPRLAPAVWRRRGGTSTQAEEKRRRVVSLC
jgi:hypothetical protein